MYFRQVAILRKSTHCPKFLFYYFGNFQISIILQLTTTLKFLTNLNCILGAVVNSTSKSSVKNCFWPHSLTKQLESLPKSSPKLWVSAQTSTKEAKYRSFIRNQFQNYQALSWSAIACVLESLGYVKKKWARRGHFLNRFVSIAILPCLPTD